MESLNMISEVCYTCTDTTNIGEVMHDNQSQAHWSYIAGVMDSDGCFMITRHKRKTVRKNHPHTVDQWAWTYLASVKICQVEPEAIDLIHKELGFGTVTIDGARPSRPNSQPIYQWGIRSREEIIPFLENVIQYLRIKKHKAEFLLKYCRTASYHKDPGYFGLSKEELVYREESYQKMRELNGKKAGATTKPRECESISDSLAL
jgi:hypothetical protein